MTEAKPSHEQEGGYIVKARNCEHGEDVGFGSIPKGGAVLVFTVRRLEPRIIGKASRDGADGVDEEGLGAREHLLGRRFTTDVVVQILLGQKREVGVAHVLKEELHERGEEVRAWHVSAWFEEQRIVLLFWVNGCGLRRVRLGGRAAARCTMDRVGA